MVFVKNLEFQEVIPVLELPNKMALLRVLIMNKVRCMLSDFGLSKVFWAEAASTACYLINRSPNSSLDFKVPEEVWSGNKPTYSHLKPFGCIAYVHISQGKLNPRAKKGVFIGYPEGVKGYKVWLIDEKKCVISRDTIFNESMFYKFNPTSQTSFQLDQNVQSAGLDHIDVTDDTEVLDQGGATDMVHDQEKGEYQNEDLPMNTETNQEQLRDYQLARDRARRQTAPPARYAEADLIAFALNAVESLEDDEPRSYKEARESSSRRE